MSETTKPASIRISAALHSDAVGVRCGCKDARGKNPLLRVFHDLARKARGVVIDSYVTCTMCGASWAWGEVCAPLAKVRPSRRHSRDGHIRCDVCAPLRCEKAR